MHYENIKKIFNIKAGLLSMMIFIGGNILSLYMDDGLLNSFLGKIVSLSGIILALTIANLLCKIKLGKAIECFGTNCMGIFVISGFILPVIQIVLKNRLNIGYCFITIIFFVITLLLSLIASILVKKVKILRLLVLGDE